METACKSDRIEFQGLGNREIIGEFNGGDITSDGGAILLRETEKRTNIIKRFANERLEISSRLKRLK